MTEAALYLLIGTALFLALVSLAEVGVTVWRHARFVVRRRRRVA